MDEDQGFVTDVMDLALVVLAAVMALLLFL